MTEKEKMTGAPLDFMVDIDENDIMGKGMRLLLVGIILGWVHPHLQGEPQSDLSRRREAMVKEQLEGRDITDMRVLEAMRAVPRHLFVPERLRPWAYADHPLPIGEGQTISQPYIVALMTQLLALEPGEKILEIGTGSGYQAAVLAQLTDQVFSMEINPELAEDARQRLKELGYGNVRVRHGDGYAGWEEHAPYDAVIITCAAPEVPEALFRQLREGGRIVMPRGDPQKNQILSVITKVKGKPVIRDVTAVRFVPMVGGKPPHPEETASGVSSDFSPEPECAQRCVRRLDDAGLRPAGTGFGEPREGLLLKSACANF